MLFLNEMSSTNSRPHCFGAKELMLHFPMSFNTHDDVIKWKYFPRYRPFVRRIHRSPVNSPHKGQWRGALMFSLIYTWIKGWVNKLGAGDLRRQRVHYDVSVMCLYLPFTQDLMASCMSWKWDMFVWCSPGFVKAMGMSFSKCVV